MTIYAGFTSKPTIEIDVPAPVEEPLIPVEVPEAEPEPVPA